MSRYMEHLHCRFHPEAPLFEDYAAGDMICPECGLVVGERMVDVSSEWREFGNDPENKQKGRVGAAQNLLYDNANLETATSFLTGAGAVDGKHNQKHTQMSSQTSSTDKALRNAHDAIRNMAGRIFLTKKVTNRAFLTYKHCYERKCLRGRSQDAIVAACLYTACRQERSPHTMREICGISTVSEKQMNQVYLKIKGSLPNSVGFEPIDVKGLVPGFCNGLQLAQEALVRKTAMHIVERANEICNVQGRAPRSIASSAIYMACLALREDKSKKDIQERTGVSEGVIRAIYKLMLPDAAKLFPEDFKFNCPLNSIPRC